MLINVSSTKGNLRHTGLMHGMQIHDALLKENYRGRCEAVSSEMNATPRPGDTTVRSLVLRLRIEIIRAGRESRATLAALVMKIPIARRGADARKRVAPNAGSDGLADEFRA